MSDTTLECPVGPFGGSSDFDISATHIAFTAKDPHLPPAWHTRQHIYTVPFKPRSAEDAKPKQLTGSIGATSSPVFSPEHKHAAAQGATHVHGALAWLEMREDGYEADRNRVMVHDLKSGQTKGVTEEWDCSPASIAWSEDAHQLFLVAEQVARVKAFRLKLKGSEDPVALTSQGSISSLSVIPTPVTQPTNKPPPTRLLLSSTSHVSPTVVSLAIVEDEGEVKQHVLSSLAKPYLDKLDPPLRRGQDFWFDGAKTKVHGWIIYPPTMQGAPDSEQEKAQWPLAFLIHGGPQGSWADSWSTRWNPSVFASRGYITVAIDPTGSTGYGQEFCDAIKGEWGGLPYQDLVAGYQHILKTCPAIDSTRTAALGA